MSGGRVFIGTDEGIVHVLDATTGDGVYNLPAMAGKIRASMAAYKPRNNAAARLYVLSMGTSATDGPRLYCFGAQ